VTVRLIAIAAVALMPAMAWAQPVVPGSGSAGGIPGGVILVPPTGTPNETSVPCGVGSTLLLAAGAATQFIFYKVPQGGSTVWFNVAGAPAVAAPPSVDLAGGMWQTWSAAQGFLPSSQINCIAPVAQTVELIWK
jgi:hypothetical protein